MDAVEALGRLGGVAGRASLLRLTTARRLAAAVKSKDVIRVRRGRYRLPDADRALARAIELGGVASHLSAAQLHGWEVAFPSTTPWVTVPRNSKEKQSPRHHLFYADISQERRHVTSAMRTVIDCARRLPFAAALAVADSAIRHADVDLVALAQEARAVRGKGAEQARRVARHASGLAANPFESVLRAIALDAGLDAVPQLAIEIRGVTVHPDVGDRERRIVLEADSWEFHAGKHAHERDCWRYTVLVVGGWVVLRFTWHQVMHDPDFVADCLRQVLDGLAERANAA